MKIYVAGKISGLEKKDIDEKFEKAVNELEATKKVQEENERLKKDSEENQDLATVAYMQGAGKNKAKLDEAREIIKKLVEGIRIISDPKVELTDVDVFVAKAEAFLKESGE